jgi:hypothetical protein
VLSVLKWREAGRNCIMRRIIICRPTLHQVLLGRTKMDGHVAPWGDEKSLQDFGWES